LEDLVFGYGFGNTARDAVSEFFNYCAARNATPSHGVSYGYADEAVLEFCNTEMFDELQAKHDANLKVSSNG
jgi:hypothetical protein